MGLVSSSAAPITSVARAVAITSGAAAMRRAWPLALALLVVGAVIFGPNGLSARDLTEPARASGALRLALWSAWMLAALPVARALLRDRSLRLVLTQPVSRPGLSAVLSTALCLANAPWILFRARGEGALDAIASSLASVVGAWGLAAPMRHRARRASTALLALTLIVTPDPWALALVSLLVGALIVPAAMESLGAETNAASSARSLPRSAVGALLVAHARLATRTASTALGRQLALVCAGAALAIPTLHNNALATVEERVRLALACVTLPLATLSMSLASTFDTPDRALRPRLISAATSASTRAFAALTAVALPVASIAMVTVTVACALAGSQRSFVAGAAAALWGAGLASIALRCARGSTGADVLRDAGRMALAVAASLVALLAAGPWAMLAPVFAIALAARAERRESMP